MQDLTLPLTQSEEFERTCNMLGMVVRRFENEAGTCLVQSRRMPVIGRFNLISRGPVIREGHLAAPLMAEIRQSVRGPLVMNAPTGAETGRSWRFARGADLALVDLLPPEQMRARLHQKWRNQLKKAEKSELSVIDQPLDRDRHDWFLGEEQAQQKARGYRSYPAGFLLAYAAANKGKARLYTAMRGRDPVAAMLVLRHGRMATYQAGITRNDGRKLCAHNLILWRVLTDLQRKGVQHLDLGRADLSDGLRRFKIGAGSRIETLAGTFWVRGGWDRQNKNMHASATQIRDAA